MMNYNQIASLESQERNKDEDRVSLPASRPIELRETECKSFDHYDNDNCVSCL